MIVTLSGISFLNTMGSGILIAALPRIAKDVGLEKNLILVSFLPSFTFQQNRVPLIMICMLRGD